MRRSFADDPTLSAALFDLLEAVFPGIGQSAEHARSLGAAWESVSTPFLAFEEGRPVSHVGIIELPLVLLGREVTAGSIHAVATHPKARRRGHYRRLMDEARSYAVSRYETLVLTTEHPEYFEPFGFRVIREHLFTLRCPSPGGGDRLDPSGDGGARAMDHDGLRRVDDGWMRGMEDGGARAIGHGGLRSINTQDPKDVALLHRLLETREPVSRVVGVVREKAIFCFNEGRRPLHYVEDQDVMVCMERKGARLTLFDVVGPKLPALDALLARIPGPVEEVEFGFAADRFTRDAIATPQVFDHDGPSYLMAHGPFAAEAEAFTLPRSART
jgi:predicted N-acetyltransferase YhbS